MCSSRSLLVPLGLLALAAPRFAYAEPLSVFGDATVQCVGDASATATTWSASWDPDDARWHFPDSQTVQWGEFPITLRVGDVTWIDPYPTWARYGAADNLYGEDYAELLSGVNDFWAEVYGSGGDFVHGDWSEGVLEAHWGRAARTSFRSQFLDGRGVRCSADGVVTGDDYPDTDGDGVCQFSDFEDTDLDYVADECDAFPDDPSEQYDSDGDGVGDWRDLCPGEDDATAVPDCLMPEEVRLSGSVRVSCTDGTATESPWSATVFAARQFAQIETYHMGALTRESGSLDMWVVLTVGDDTWSWDGPADGYAKQFSTVTGWEGQAATYVWGWDGHQTTSLTLVGVGDFVRVGELDGAPAVSLDWAAADRIVLQGVQPDGGGYCTYNGTGALVSEDADTDGDGVPDDVDVCPTDPENDADADLVCDGSDLCVGAANADADGDQVCDDLDLCAGNDATGDYDGDATCDDQDNCVLDANASQADADGDGIGNACEADTDRDGVIDDDDNCDALVNVDQADTDADAQGDACDADDDGDGVADVSDNCALTVNAGQADFDQDGLGDACDGDDDADGIADSTDQCPGSPMGVVISPSTGCSGTQWVALQVGAPSAYPNAGQYQARLVQAVTDAVRAGLLTAREGAVLKSEAARSR